MDEVENKNHLLGECSYNINEMQFRKLLKGILFLMSEAVCHPGDDSLVWKMWWLPSLGRNVTVHQQECSKNSMMLNKQAIQKQMHFCRQRNAKSTSVEVAAFAHLSTKVTRHTCVTSTSLENCEDSTCFMAPAQKNFYSKVIRAKYKKKGWVH